MKPTLSFIEAVKTCFGKYATFSGRARRSEFWWFYLLGLVPNLGTSYMVQWKMAKASELEQALYANLGNAQDVIAQAEAADSTFYLWIAVFGILSLVLLIPTLAAWARRLHDVGKSGHLLWLILLCGIGGLVPLAMAIPDGQRGPNQYGPDPKE